MLGLFESSQIVSDPSCIDFGIGQPQLELLPRDLLWQAAQALLSRTPNTPLQYGHAKGDGLFRHSLAKFLSPAYSGPQDPASFFATGGASQALHLIACTFAKPGQTVLVEEPTYFLVPQIFKDHGLKLAGVPLEDDGPNLDKLEKAIKKHKPKLFYTIPVFQNPTGHTTSEEKRRAILELAEKYDFLVVADEVYQLLYYGSLPPAPYAAHLQSNRVISVGSFSKILAPGMRLGWIQSSAEHLATLTNLGLLKSGGGLNHFTSCLVGEALANGTHARYTEKLRREYAFRVDLMHDCLQKKLGDRVKYHKPEGGYFFWLELDKKADAEALATLAGKHKTGFRAGVRFSHSGKCRNCLRLSFAHYNENAISVGVDRLAKALDEYKT